MSIIPQNLLGNIKDRLKDESIINELSRELTEEEKKRIVKASDFPVEPMQEQVSAVPKESNSDYQVSKLTFRTTKEFSSERIGSFIYPRFIQPIIHLPTVANFIHVALGVYAGSRGYKPKGFDFWIDVPVPDQLQPLLGCKWICIDGNGQSTLISKLFKS